MVTLRLTQKLLRLVGAPAAVTQPATGVLGDWTGGLFYVGRKRYVLLVSEHPRLPVLLPGCDLKNLGRNFPSALAEVLAGVSVSKKATSRELEAALEVAIAPTSSRSLVGTINDFSFLVSHRLREHPDVDLVEAALWLSRTPVGPLGHERPCDVTRRLLGAAS